MVALVAGRGFDARQVRPGGRLRHRDRADVFAGDELRQPAILLFVGSQVVEVGHQDVVLHTETHPDRSRCEELLGEDLIEPPVGEPHSAVLLRKRPTEQTVLTCGAPNVAAHLAVTFPLLGVRSTFSFEKCTRGLAKVVVDLFKDVATQGLPPAQPHATIAGSASPGVWVLNSCSPSSVSSSW